MGQYHSHLFERLPGKYHPYLKKSALATRLALLVVSMVA
jgi:hypothetical protein